MLGLKKHPVEHYQSSIGLPEAPTSTLLEQCEKNSSQQRIALNILQEACRTIPEDQIKKL